MAKLQSGATLNGAGSYGPYELKFNIYGLMAYPLEISAPEQQEPFAIFC